MRARGLTRAPTAAGWTQQLDFAAHPSYIDSLAWTPDGTRLITASGDATLRAWDTRTRVASRMEREHWIDLRASIAAREDLEQIYPTLEGEEQAAARAELIRRRDR